MRPSIPCFYEKPPGSVFQQRLNLKVLQERSSQHAFTAISLRSCSAVSSSHFGRVH